MTEDPTEDEITDAFGPYHDFWLLDPSETDSRHSWNLLGRKDAPVRLSDVIFGYIEETLKRVPTFNPWPDQCIATHGLHRYGPTLITLCGAECFRQVCLEWANAFSEGPEPLVLTHGWICREGEMATIVESSQPPIDDEENGVTWKPYRFRTSRVALVLALKQLAEFGEQTASGKYFIQHFGV